MDNYKYIGCYNENNKTPNTQSLNIVPGTEYTYNTCKQKAIDANAAVFGMQFNSDKNTVQCFISNSDKDYKTQLNDTIKNGTASLKDKINLDEDFNFNTLKGQCGKMKNGYAYGGSDVYATYATAFALNMCSKHINLDNIISPNNFMANVHDLNTRFDDIIKSLRLSYLNYLRDQSVNNTKLYHKDLYTLKQINLEYDTIQIELTNNIKMLRERITTEDNNIKSAKSKKYIANNDLKKIYSNDNAALGEFNDKKLQNNVSRIENIVLFTMMTASFFFYYKYSPKT